MPRPHHRIPLLVEPLLVDVRKRLEARFGDRVREIRLFGSFARGEARADSDVDILILLDRLEDSRERIAVIDEVVAAGLDHEFLVGPLILDEEGLARHRREETALARILEEEGIPA